MGYREITQQSHYVTDWLDKRARLTPNRIALIDYTTKTETTFAEWNRRVNRTANFLKNLGVCKGDRVAVYASNKAEYLDLFWAAPKLGAMLQNLNWRLTVFELTGIIENGAPSVLIYSEDWRPQVEELKSSFTTVEHIVAMTNPGTGERDFAERESMSAELYDTPELSLDDPWGEVGRAFLVVADGYAEDELREFLVEHLAKYKLPRSFVVPDTLPLTAMGKIDKKLLTTKETPQ